ncbi:MAG: exo-alpha-sialidase, partial [Oscillospiraceae bacterium]|nr:exo-alpha-sialidase [Oscillospiraceae bacterium]
MNGAERLLLITACPGWGTDSAGNQYGFNVSYSDDDGETWSEYEHFYSYFSDGDANDAIVAMASLVQLKDEDGNYIEKWMGVFHNYSYVNYKTYLTFDEAGNMQWSEPVPFLSEHRAMESSHQMCEIGMFRSPDGSRIIGLARSQSHMHLSTMIWSDDEGETWSEPVELPGSLAGERHKAHYDPISGKLVITFREINYDKDGDGLIESGDWICGDWGLWVGTYEDLMNLEDGEYCVTIDEDFTQNTYSGDTGYAGYVILDDGTFVMSSYGHWEEDFSKSWTGGVTTDLCYIMQARFTLAQLEHEFLNKHCYEDGQCTICGEADPDYVPETEMVATGWSGYTIWTLTDDGVLTFAPSGQTEDGQCNLRNYWKVDGVLTLPWGEYADQITKVVIEDGIHDIGQMAFYELKNLETVELGADVV